MASSGQGLINRSKADCVGNYSDPWAVRTNLLIVVEDTPWSRGPSNLPYNDLIGNYSVLDYEFIDTAWQARVIRWFAVTGKTVTRGTCVMAKTILPRTD